MTVLLAVILTFPEEITGIKGKMESDIGEIN